MKENKFESIMLSARNLFGRYGPRRTSLDELARVARVAKVTIYNYFGSKEGLYLEVLRREIDDVVKKISDAVARKVESEDRLRAYFAARFQFMREAVNILNLDRERIERILPDAESIRRELFEKELKIIQSILEQGVKQGELHLHYPQLTAEAILYAFRGFEITWLVEESRENIDKYIKEMMTIIFYGLKSEKSQTERRQTS